MDFKSELFDLSGKVAIVTGSTRGIGRSIAEALAAFGARVVVSSRKAEACDEVAGAIRAKRGEAIAVPCNMSRLPDLDNLVARTLDKWGRIDVLVCNAAVNIHYGSMTEISEETYDKIMDTNVKSNLWLCNKVIPGMASRKDGAIVIVSSVAGFKGSDKTGVYAMSKAADAQMARNIAVEWGRHNVRANCISPGFVLSDSGKTLLGKPAVYERMMSMYPLGRGAEPWEMAGPVVMLASKAGQFITGQNLIIDGGTLITHGRYD